MVSPIDPAIKSLEALNIWSSSDDQYLVEKEGKTSDGKKVRYLAAEMKPRGFRVLLDNILSIFGCRTAWKLDNVSATLQNVLSERQDLKPVVEKVRIKLFQKIDGFNSHHHGAIDSNKLKALSVFQAPTSPAIVASPTSGQTPLNAAEKPPAEPEAIPVPKKVVLQQPPVQQGVNSSDQSKQSPTSSELWTEFRRKEAERKAQQAKQPVSPSLAQLPLQAAAIPPAVHEQASVEGQAGKPAQRLKDQRKDRALLPKGKQRPSREFLHKKPVAPASGSVQEKKVVEQVSHQQPPKKIIGGQRMIPAFDPQQALKGLRKTNGKK